MSKPALIVIDIQNDYFPGGKFPLWNADATLANIEIAIAKAREKDIPIIFIQHIADANADTAPFFNSGTQGADIHPRLKTEALNATIITKHFADAFHQTVLEKTLSEFGADELLICGMMTQNCVTHTALSKSAEKYSVKILTDGCTTTDQMIHLFALDAISTRIALGESAALL